MGSEMCIRDRYNNSPCSNGMWPNREVFIYDIRTKLKTEIEPSINSEVLIQTGGGGQWKPADFVRHAGSNTSVVCHNDRDIVVHDSQLQVPKLNVDTDLVMYLKYQLQKTRPSKQLMKSLKLAIRGEKGAPLNVCNTLEFFLSNVYMYLYLSLIHI